MPNIDLNCDMGEGFPNDADIMPYISSVNIACGYHAGDTDTMKRTVELALKHNVAIGAHPSYPDRENFGRTDLIDVSLRYEDIPAIITDQLNQLQEICKQAGTKLHHIKPHGALYNRAAWDANVTGYICTGIIDIDSSLLFYGLSGSEMKPETENYNLRFINEVFADRTYQDDGSLTPRDRPNALITDRHASIRQVLQMIQQGRVRSVNGNDVSVQADTICIHGDGAHAVEFAEALYEMLVKEGIQIQSP